jgi:hypothetical protein
MARQKKCYNSSAKNENSYFPKNGNGNGHQSRGGGKTVRKNRVHKYPTRPVETVASPTWIASRQAKKLPV